MNAQISNNQIPVLIIQHSLQIEDLDNRAIDALLQYLLRAPSKDMR